MEPSILLVGQSKSQIDTFTKVLLKAEQLKMLNIQDGNTKMYISIELTMKI